jgi:hypothetical protein
MELYGHPTSKLVAFIVEAVLSAPNDAGMALFADGKMIGRRGQISKFGGMPDGRRRNKVRQQDRGYQRAGGGQDSTRDVFDLVQGQDHI